MQRWRRRYSSRMILSSAPSTAMNCCTMPRSRDEEARARRCATRVSASSAVRERQPGAAVVDKPAINFFSRQVLRLDETVSQKRRVGTRHSRGKWISDTHTHTYLT
eukprot:1265015-Prymnesium_polylepis.1